MRVYSSEALLAGHQRIAVVVVLHVPDLGIVGHADLVVRAQDQTGPFTPQELPDGLDLFRRGRLPGDHVIQPEHEQGVGVRQDPLVEG